MKDFGFAIFLVMSIQFPMVCIGVGKCWTELKAIHAILEKPHDGTQLRSSPPTSQAEQEGKP